MKRILVLASGLALLALAGADWPQWQGPDRTNVSPETGLLKEWPEGGPQRRWLSREGGLGYSGMAVVGDRLYTLGAMDKRASLIALNAATGEKVWIAPIGEVLSNGWGDGPRATPTVDGERVYAMTGKGELVCCQVSDGKLVWQVSMKDFGGRVPGWGYCESVLVDGEQVVCTPGGKQGAMLALNKLTGEKIWQSKDFTRGAQYSSIIVANVGGQRQYVQLTQEELVGIDPESGDVLWSSPWEGRTAVIPTPIYHDGRVYITSGYGVGCKLVDVTKEKAADVYQNKVMKNHHGGVVRLDDHLFGYSDGVGWVCQAFKSGELVWNNKRELGKGCLTYADGMLYLVDERDGDVVLIEASTDGWKEKGRFRLDPQTEQRNPKGRIWTHPTIAGGKLYLRDQELIYCYDIAK